MKMLAAVVFGFVSVLSEQLLVVGSRTRVA